MCATTLETSLRKLDGVQGVSISLGRGEISVQFVPGVDISESDLERTVDSSGFTLRSIKMPGEE